MIFFLAYFLMLVGLLMAGMMGFVPASMNVPPMLKILLFLVGIIISSVGYIILYGRANKTGAKHLIEPARKGYSLWFYVYRDGSILITPSIRRVEGQLYAPELDAQIQDFKSYKIFDHTIRIIPEGIGHAVDLSMVLYTKLLKTKFGFEKLQDARTTANKLEKLNPISGTKHIPSFEGIITEKVLEKASKMADRGDVE